MSNYVKYWEERVTKALEILQDHAEKLINDGDVLDVIKGQTISENPEPNVVVYHVFVEFEDVEDSVLGHFAVTFEEDSLEPTEAYLYVSGTTYSYTGDLIPERPAMGIGR